MPLRPLVLNNHNLTGFVNAGAGDSYKVHTAGNLLSLSVLSSDISPRLDYVLSSLKPRDKQMMIMRFKEEKTYQEIGDSFGMSKQAVDQHIRNAIKKLRKDPYFNLYIREEILNLVSQS